MIVHVMTTGKPENLKPKVSCYSCKYLSTDKLKSSLSGLLIWFKYHGSNLEKIQFLTKWEAKSFSPAFLQFSLAVLSLIYTPEWGDVRRIRYPNQGHGTMIQLNLDPKASMFHTVSTIGARMDYNQWRIVKSQIKCTSWLIRLANCSWFFVTQT